MFQEDAEYFDHQQQLVAQSAERGTGQVDLKRDDWVESTISWRRSNIDGGGCKWILTDLLGSDNYGDVRIKLGVTVIKLPGTVFRVYADGLTFDANTTLEARAFVAGHLKNNDIPAL